MSNSVTSWPNRVSAVIIFETNKTKSNSVSFYQRNNKRQYKN